MRKRRCRGGKNNRDGKTGKSERKSDRCRGKESDRKVRRRRRRGRQALGGAERQEEVRGRGVC